jgi:hypothetical protein
MAIWLEIFVEAYYYAHSLFNTSKHKVGAHMVGGMPLPIVSTQNLICVRSYSFDRLF